MTPLIIAAAGATLAVIGVYAAIYGGQVAGIREEQDADTDRLIVGLVELRDDGRPLGDDTLTWPLISDRRRPAAVRAIGGRWPA